MIVEGLKLMVLGMGIVFVFLVLLMFLIILSAKIFKEDVLPHKATVAGEPLKAGDELIAVLSAAVSAYRARKEKD